VGVGSDGAAGDAVAGASAGGAQGASRAVLGGDRGGLKTRTWEQVEPALEHLVTAARRRRTSPSLHPADPWTGDVSEGGDTPDEANLEAP